MNDPRRLRGLAIALALVLGAIPSRLCAEDGGDLDAARDCAARLLAPVAARSGTDLTNALVRSQWLHVRRTSIDLPIRIYAAALLTSRPGHTVTFAAGERCTLIGGDVSEIFGVTMTTDEMLGLAIVQYNEAVRGSPSVKYDQPLRTVRSLLQLGSTDAFPRILNSVDEIPHRSPKRTSKEAQRALRNLRQTIKAPEILSGSGGITLIRFFTWNELGGTVSHDTVTLLADARISLSRVTLATRVGAYKQFIGRM